MRPPTPTDAAIVLLTTALLAAPSCRREDDSKPQPARTNVTAEPPPPAPRPAPSHAAPADTSTVASYPDEVPLGTVTVEVLQEFAVHQAADLNSPVIAHVGHGEYINAKATHSSWMRIEYPSGVGQLSPGWVDLRNVLDPRVRVHHGPLPARLPPQFHKPRQ
jgi:hypothetical protein